MAFKTKHEAVVAYDAASREAFAYHHALVASMNGEARRVSSINIDGDTYTWSIAFTPVYFAAIIIEVFKSKMTGDESTRVFWLMDWKQPRINGYRWDSLHREAQMHECAKLGLDRTQFQPHASDAGAMVAEFQEEPDAIGARPWWLVTAIEP